jgi:hypothetical protein
MLLLTIILTFSMSTFIAIVDSWVAYLQVDMIRLLSNSMTNSMNEQSRELLAFEKIIPVDYAAEIISTATVSCS